MSVALSEVSDCEKKASENAWREASPRLLIAVKDYARTAWESTAERYVEVAAHWRSDRVAVAHASECHRRFHLA